MIYTPNLGNSLERHIKKYYINFEHLDKQDQKALVNLLIQYLFKAISASVMEARFKKIIGEPKFRAIELRRTLLEKGYFLRNLKLWLYFYVANKAKVSQKLLSSFSIKSQDRKLHLQLLTETTKFLADLSNKGFKAKYLWEFDEASTHILTNKEFIVQTRKFVYRKAAFAFQQNGEEANDVIQELETDALQALMFTYPKIETMEHAWNIMFRAVHNKGVNYLEKYSSKARGRLQTGKNGETIRVTVPINSPEALDFMSTDENASIAASLDGKSYDNLNLKMSVSKILSQYTGKRQIFLNLISGNFDASFSLYLKTEHKVRQENDVYFDKVEFKEYLDKVLQFLNVPQEKGLKFIELLKSQLISLSDKAA